MIIQDASPQREWQPVSGVRNQDPWPQQEWHRIIGNGTHAYPGHNVLLSVRKEHGGTFCAEITRDGVLLQATGHHKTQADGKRWADMYYHCFIKDTL